VLNVVHVLPRYELDGLTWVTVLPHAADVVWDPAGEQRPSILIYDTTSRGAARVAIDGEQWWWLSDSWELIASEPHGMGPRPWAEFRTKSPPQDDYWDRGEGQSLVDGTLELGRISAHMAWARKIHSKNAAFVVVGSTDELPPGQVLNGEDMLFARGDNIQLGTLDMILPVGDFRDEINEVIEDVSEHEGVPMSIVAMDAGSGGKYEITPAAYEALAKVRNRQIKHLEMAELRLARSASAELRRVGQPDSVSDEAIRDGFRVRYARLTYADHPSQRVATAKEQFRVGASDPYEFYQDENPGLTRAEAKTEVDAHVEAWAEFNDVVASRNISLSGDGGLSTLPEKQGMIGGLTRAANESPPDGVSSDESRDPRAG
jgi:hypothetical protein